MATENGFLDVGYAMDFASSLQHQQSLLILLLIVLGAGTSSLEECSHVVAHIDTKAMSTRLRCRGRRPGSSVPFFS